MSAVPTASSEALPDPVEHGRRREGVDAGQHHHELLAAVAGHHVVLAHRLAEHPGEGPQGPVAGVVAVAVVEALEVVEVGHPEGERRAGLAQVAHALLHGPPVEQPGERVGLGLQLRAGHRPQHAEPGADLGRHPLQPIRHHGRPGAAAAPARWRG